jgi:hypothetical protein
MYAESKAEYQNIWDETVGTEGEQGITNSADKC